MKITTFSGILLSMLLLATKHAAAAPIITLNPSSDSLTGAGTVFVDINIANLDTLLAGFQMDFLFDSTVFTPLIDPPAGFGSHLGDIDLFEAFGSFDTSTPGVVDLALVSFFFDPADLDDLQGDPAGSGNIKDFTLATIGLSRTTGGSGLTTLSTADILLSDFEANAITPVSNPSVSIELDPTPVPVPGTALLMLIAGLGLCLPSRRGRSCA